MAEEVIFEYAGHTESEKIDKRKGSVILTYIVRLKSVRRNLNDDDFSLSISSGSKALFDKYPRGCEVPVLINKTQQRKLLGADQK
jgi:hypothetical protein